MIGCFNKSVLLTYLGIGLSLFGIYNLLIMQEYESMNRVDMAVICLILAGICDLFDGVVARRCKRNDTQKKFGVQIDSLADVISFLIFPAVLLHYIWRDTTGAFFLVIVFYVLCGINRLAWFNIQAESFDNVYQGLPVTYAALVIPCLYVFAGGTAPSFLFPIVYCVLGLLFILNIRIPKPTGVFYGIFGILAVALIVMIVI